MLNASLLEVCRPANRWPRAGVQPGRPGRNDIERPSRSPRACGCSRTRTVESLRRAHSDVLGGAHAKVRRKLPGGSVNGCSCAAGQGAARSRHGGGRHDEQWTCWGQLRRSVAGMVVRPICRPARTEQPEHGPLGCPRPSWRAVRAAQGGGAGCELWRERWTGLLFTVRGCVTFLTTLA